MLVLSGKKLRYAILGMFAMFMVVALAINSNEEKNGYIPTVSLPVSGKVVVVDAGHGIPDERCRSGRWNNRGTNKFKNCA